MASKKETYFFIAQKHYCEGLSLKEINELMPVSARTLSLWKAEGDWEEKKKNYLASSIGSSEVLAKEIELMINRIKSEGLQPGMAKELANLVTLKEKLEKKYDIVNNAMVIMREWAKFLKKRHPENANDQISIISEFIEYIDKGE